MACALPFVSFPGSSLGMQVVRALPGQTRARECEIKPQWPGRHSEPCHKLVATGLRAGRTAFRTRASYSAKTEAFWHNAIPVDSVRFNMSKAEALFAIEVRTGTEAGRYQNQKAHLTRDFPFPYPILRVLSGLCGKRSIVASTRNKVLTIGCNWYKRIANHVRNDS